MKKLIAVTFALAALNGAALAADLPIAAPAPSYKAPAVVPPMPVYSWTGFYLNAGAGYGIWQADDTTTTAAGANFGNVNSMGGKGIVGTAGGGFDYQFGLNLGAWNPQFVVGAFGDYDFESLKGSINDTANNFSGTIKATDSWHAGARLGLVPFPQLLAYTNGGVTGIRFGGASMVTGAGAPTGDSTGAFSKIGWFLGGGTETSLSPLLPRGFSLRTEYRYDYYNTVDVPETGPGGALVSTIHFKPTVETLTTSLVYKFN